MAKAKDKAKDKDKAKVVSAPVKVVPLMRPSRPQHPKPGALSPRALEPRAAAAAVESAGPGRRAAT